MRKAWGRRTRKWVVVALGLALLCGLPVIASALPVSVPALTASELRGRILASADESYAGYAESNATFGLPPLTGISDVTSLLDGVTKMRIWEATPDRWRVDALSDAGEHDTYQLGSRSYTWDSGAELLTAVIGQPTLRLPRPADLTPPALALRVLAEAGQQARFSVIAPLRVAGRSAAGLRMTPADPASTVGQVDIWADPSSGLPLLVRIFGRGTLRPAVESEFFQVSPWRPNASVLTPVRGPGTGLTESNAQDLNDAIYELGLVALPRELAGRSRDPLPAQFDRVGIYGGGLATFVAVGVRGHAGRNLVADAISAGGTQLDLAGGTGALIGAPLINAVIIRPPGSYVTFLVAGTVSAQVIELAATTLVTDQESQQ